MEGQIARKENSMIFLVVLGFVLTVYVVMGLIFAIGLFLKTNPANSDQPFVSVIVAARNEENFIAKCVERLLEQDYPHNQFEVIVVDDRSFDKTAERVLEFSDPRIRLIQIADKPAEASGKKYALERGVQSSRGEILLFTDADCLVKPTWISAMIRYFSKETGFVVGYSEVQASGFFERWQKHDFMSMMAAAMGGINMGFAFAASGQNLAYRRSAFDKAGGFRSIMHRISGDDVLMLQLVRMRTHYKIVFAGDTRAFNTTKPETSFKNFIHQRSRWASNAEILRSMNPFFFFYLSCVAGLNFLLPIGILAGDTKMQFACVFGVAVKGTVDFCLSYLGAKQFKTNYSLLAYVSWFVLQPTYILLVGIRGLAGKFIWK